jgi:hypothetical protein
MERNSAKSVKSVKIDKIGVVLFEAKKRKKT